MLVRTSLALFVLAAHGSGGTRSLDEDADGARGSACESPGEIRRFTLTALGPSLGKTTGASGLSDTGFVTGSLDAHDEREAPVACRWVPRAGSAMDTVLVPEPPSWTGSTAVDVNDSGTLVGSFGEDAAFLTRGYRCRDGVIDELFTPLGQRAFPLALNDAGWIVGYAGIQPPGTPGAVLWDPELRASFVADLTRAVDINSRGEIVGYRSDAAGIARGFLWSEGELIPLGSLDPRGLGAVYPKAIDAHGCVVGVSFIRGREHAFRWTRAGGMTELFAPRPTALRSGTAARAGASPDVAALDLNDAGWVVGYARTAGEEGALLWAPDGTVCALTTLVPELTADGSGTLRVQRINAAGQIAGVLSKAGKARTVVLTPAPVRAATRVPGAVGLLAR